MSAFDSGNDSVSIERFYTPLNEAVVEIALRREDAGFVHEVEDFLKYDIPEHFKNGPIFYLARHVATPNFETLRFIELAKPYGLRMVIGQDTKDIFVSNNSLKRSLGKLSVVKMLTHDKREIFQKFSVVDFDSAQGRRLKDIRTKSGQNLIEFHTNLFREIYPNQVEILDDAEWIDRNHRGDLVAHYKNLLALFLVHGIMFEFNPAQDPEECHFVHNVLDPAFSFIEQKFGRKPLIVCLVDSNMEKEKDWEAYPSVLYKIIESALLP